MVRYENPKKKIKEIEQLPPEPQPKKLRYRLELSQSEKEWLYGGATIGFISFATSTYLLLNSPVVPYHDIYGLPTDPNARLIASSIGGMMVSIFGALGGKVVAQWTSRHLKKY